ncbi:MAG: phosphatidylglycerophosphatase A [Hoeflea sp.]|uniref:phosphatidylglycerophosphatase A family protein n=1 Tax=Hoeflea sp. TaxID=1940281 RepID=UPI001D7A2C7F|nr:phosphatidylglycerophosphatase A [Hoeflea sp.]MBU4530435.1 phosphatidylglycerophosphatase A [Alphaproteobacteria bacterium]MBU4545222.1 phosphatidylglycerophosphatase A [Alphaproteobacteria bacterium]MBU4549578.1 phosphatidylglycerophosphatase A [Alphaproteobacteria bacterium]MBV1722025.1 phosphatidylglycerophosphatase A [Hoeflea sp.]MBV1761375.1 phosphatidylglycerophosphatase A [Hoeflea sp.]
MELFPPIELLDPPGAGMVPVWTWLVATWFGAGLLAPFRAGLAVFAVLPLLALAITLPRYVLPVLAVAVFLIGVHVSSELELATGDKDDRRIVIDEVAAFILGAAIIRQAGWRMLVPFAAIFLFVDRLKPWPMAYVEQVPSGWGVMMDDLVPAIALGLIFVSLQALINRRTT